MGQAGRALVLEEPRGPRALPRASPGHTRSIQSLGRDGRKHNTQAVCHSSTALDNQFWAGAARATGQISMDSHDRLGVGGFLSHVAVWSCQGTELALEHTQGTAPCLTRHLQDEEAGGCVAFRAKNYPRLKSPSACFFHRALPAHKEPQVPSKFGACSSERDIFIMTD